MVNLVDKNDCVENVVPCIHFRNIFLSNFPLRNIINNRLYILIFEVIIGFRNTVLYLVIIFEAALPYSSISSTNSSKTLGFLLL